MNEAFKNYSSYPRCSSWKVRRKGPLDRRIWLWKNFFMRFLSFQRNSFVKTRLMIKGGGNNPSTLDEKFFSRIWAEKTYLLGVKSCEESIAPIPEAWKYMLLIKLKKSNFLEYKIQKKQFFSILRILSWFSSFGNRRNRFLAWFFL